MDLLHLANQILEWRDRINRLTQENNRVETQLAFMKQERDHYKQENDGLRKDKEHLQARIRELDVWTKPIGPNMNLGGTKIIKLGAEPDEGERK